MASSDFRENTRQLQQKINYRVIGRHMKDIRVACNMTQSSIAEKMGVGSKYYTSIETGYSKISLARFIPFLCITNASADAVLTGCHADLQTNKLQDVQDEQNVYVAAVEHPGSRRLNSSGAENEQPRRASCTLTRE